MLTWCIISVAVPDSVCIQFDRKYRWKICVNMARFRGKYGNKNGHLEDYPKIRLDFNLLGDL